MILFLYRLAIRAAAPLFSLSVWLRGLRGLEETGHYQERRGRASLPRPAGTLVWVHAASVGEMRSILPLVRRLIERNDHLTCLITTVTVTAAKLVRENRNPRILHQYAPIDHPVWVALFLDHWKPDAVLWVESELWPTMLTQIHRRALPLALVNGRLSERSAQRWLALPSLIKRLISYFDVCLAQSADVAARFKKLGAASPIVAGNMKYASAPLSCDNAALQALQNQIGDRPAMLFASTHDGEEAIAARAFDALRNKIPGLLLVVMPRHAARGPAIAELLEKEGIACVLRSKAAPITPATQAYVADTMGEAGLFFRLCKVVYVGNSLISVPGGGHNPIEPAQLGCAVIYGPHMWNFSEIDAELRAVHGALMVRDEKNLFLDLHTLLTQPGKRTALGNAARRFMESQNGVLETVLEHLRPVLSRAGIAA